MWSCRIGASSLIASCTVTTDGQHLVVDLDQVQRLPGRVWTGCRYRRYRLALVQRLPAGQDVVPEVSELDGRLPQIDDAVSRVVYVREVFGGDDGQDARRRLRPARVDRPDMCVGVRAAQDGPVDQAGRREVGPVQGPPGYLVGAVVAERARADHVELRSRQDHVGLVLSCGQRLTPWVDSEGVARSVPRSRRPAARIGDLCTTVVPAESLPPRSRGREPRGAGT